MSVEEMQYNGEAKQDNLLSSDGLLTYRRRKRVRDGQSNHAQEDTALSADEEAVNSASRYGNKKDIGWEHGKPIDGNRYHWKCKYCEFVGQSGGVTRLKKHLAGGWHVTTCPKVPKHISEAMNEHLRELKNSKLSKGKKREKEMDTREENNVENDIEENEMYTGSPYQESSHDNLERNEPNMQASLDSSFISSQVNGKDFGWEHGKTINGNRYHWKCKWCNFIGRSGGVTRLKKHLAGGWNVTSCTMVPQHIANAMNNHLMELRKKRLFKSRRMDSETENDIIDDTPLSTIPYTENVEADFGVLQLTNGDEQDDKTFKSGHSNNGHRSRQELMADMAKAFNTSQKSKRSARRRSRTGNQRSRDFYRRLSNVAEQTRNFTAKAAKAPHDTNQYTNICEGQYCTSRMHDHWRSVLEHILQLPEIKGAGGIESCIIDALMHDHSAKYNANYSDISEPRDKYNHRDVSNNGIHYETLEAIANRKKCQHILSEVLCSEKFILLCNLLCESFQGIEVDKVFGFGQINQKMKTGVYGHSPRLFNLDIRQMWRNLEKVGEEIAHLASSLSEMSHDFSTQKAEEDITHEASPQNFEDDQQTAAAAPENIIPDLNHKEATTTPPILCLCRQCGNKTTDSNEPILTCKECNASYHFSCIDPSYSEKETSNDSTWTCSSCSNKNTQSLALSLHVNNRQELHGHCGVCERLDIPEEEENFLPKVNRVHHQLALPLPIKNEDLEKQLASSSTAAATVATAAATVATAANISRLCKQCGTCEDEDRRFIVCGHSQCPYKYYHIRCLKTRQIATFQQQNRQCWYCPSCLCRACFQDRDDSLIVLCDGCDEAYHTYCMKPARSSVPKGRWYCLQCSMAKAKEGMRRYEEWVLQQHAKKDEDGSGKASFEDSGALDVLLRAIDLISSEEYLGAGSKEG